MRGGVAVLVLAGALGAAGCGGQRAPADRIVLGEETDPLPPAVRVQVDSGNAAYRAGELQRARAHYARATELDPESFAGWYGLAMAADALGDPTTAATARRRAQDIAGGGPVSPHPGGNGSNPHGF
jgi:Flp pilus assembly protein TadD